MKNSSEQMRQLHAYVANESTLRQRANGRNIVDQQLPTHLVSKP